MSFTHSPAFEEIEKLASKYAGEPDFSYFDKWAIDLEDFNCYKREHAMDVEDIARDLRQDFVKKQEVYIYWPVELALISPLVAMVKIVEKMKNDPQDVIDMYKDIYETVEREKQEEAAAKRQEEEARKRAEVMAIIEGPKKQTKRTTRTRKAKATA